MEWIVIWLLCLASVRVLKRAVVDGWVQITDPQRQPPSLAERERRAELAQRQFETTGAPGIGQAFADRLASRIVNPPPRPPWITAALQYLGLLLADAFANARRRHDAKQKQREERERGDQHHHDQPHHDQRAGPYCWRCEVNRVAHDDDLCTPCALRVTSPCRGCGVRVPVAEQQDGRCTTCQAADRAAEADAAASAAASRPGPARLTIPPR